MSRLPSDSLQVDETNAMLQRVAGLGFSTQSLKTVGGDAGRIDPNTLQVEDTNSAVSRIVGKGFITQQLKENQGRSSMRYLVEDDNLAVLKKALEDIRVAGAELVKANPDEKLQYEDIMLDMQLFIKACEGMK